MLYKFTNALTSLPNADVLKIMKKEIKEAGQSKTMSLIESSASVVAGYLITVLIQYWLYPLFGINIPVRDAFLISIVIVFAAFLKNFTVRRIFNSIHTKA